MLPRRLGAQAAGAQAQRAEVDAGDVHHVGLVVCGWRLLVRPRAEHPGREVAAAAQVAGVGGGAQGASGDAGVGGGDPQFGQDGVGQAGGAQVDAAQRKGVTGGGGTEALWAGRVGRCRCRGHR
ncbi:hypothetical protein OHA72_04520 [Dactylosporangium sp. NBC_01737]|uniref:hypothetical protein n=1 Tax=Dactylosporangium sp. NBC_01737 TaxID=2975959 RepID=UPI002E148234|nr:hypothetical protein OHA72_04520 [Dactylosporangium sp. NBC_01737]